MQNFDRFRCPICKKIKNLFEIDRDRGQIIKLCRSCAAEHKFKIERKKNFEKCMYCGELFQKNKSFQIKCVVCWIKSLPKNHKYKPKIMNSYQRKLGVCLW